MAQLEPQDSKRLTRGVRRERLDKAAFAIAERKKVPTDRLLEILDRMENLSSFDELIDQFGRTAQEHGFWEAHLRSALEKVNVKYETFCDWFAANVADHPLAVEENPPAEKVKNFEEATARGKALDAETYTKCDTIHTLVVHQIVGDPFVFLGLIGTEVAEAMESCRKGNWEDPDGVFEELADAVIRIFDFVSRFSGPRWGHSLEASENFLRILRAKMAVNEVRPFLHGKKY